jgi:hypothetical protein
MDLYHQLDEVKRLLDETTKALETSQDELYLALEALRRETPDWTHE